MKYKNTNQMDFFSEMSERQVSASEFFSKTLLESLDRNFGFKNVLISYFDTQGNFLSWIDKKGLQLNNEDHPYRKFLMNDVIRHIIYQDAVRDKLTYFNVASRLYKSTDIINKIDYSYSSYVRFLEENFQANYSVNMAFGINAYIQVTFFKSLEKGDFTIEEIELLENIYIYIANFYKNFKKHEQSKIVSTIQEKIISLGEKAYLITDDFNRVMICNDIAKNYLKEILDSTIVDQINDDSPCNWLTLLLGERRDINDKNKIQTHVIKNYTFKTHIYDQSYSNGIIDRYRWITIIPPKVETKNNSSLQFNMPLTQAEKKVAELMYKGLTYQEIANKLVVSYHTVKKHVQNIYTKCGVTSRFQLYKWFEDQE